MSDERIAQEITQLVAEIIERSVEEVWNNRDRHLFQELGIDSLLALEMIAAIEKRYKIEIPEERLQDVVTLSKTIALTQKMLDEQALNR